MNKAFNRLISRVCLALTATAVQPFAALAQSPMPTARSMPLPVLQSSPVPPGVQPAPSAAPVAVPVDSSYKLGAGDLVRVEMFDIPELTFEPRYTVLLDGALNLPWVGGVSVQGLTIVQATEQLKERYKKFVQNPVITVSLLAPRPLKIGIIGAVNRPGSYIVSTIGSEITQSSLGQRSSFEGGSQWPTVSKAIQTAGGIAQMANIREIEVRRPQVDGSQETIKINLWKYLQAGELAQDVPLKDGDTIFIPTATKLDPTEVSSVAMSNFSPEQIQVNVVGEVMRPGGVAVRPNSTLMQAVLAAGGINPGRGNRAKVELVRLMPDGKVDRREFKFDVTRGLDETSNPAIRQNDVIVVNRSATAKVSDILGAVVSPITGAFGLLRLLLGN
ncbi:polysaccharide biosynthesis/export family protein [Cyanobacteria bacterium FACHB-63]|nr:polysaccharide biosynthesis/export family protein [Cyanobacteria bacterium FACHB-63]